MPKFRTKFLWSENRKNIVTGNSYNGFLGTININIKAVLADNLTGYKAKYYTVEIIDNGVMQSTFNVSSNLLPHRLLQLGYDVDLITWQSKQVSIQSINVSAPHKGRIPKPKEDNKPVIFFVQCLSSSNIYIGYTTTLNKQFSIMQSYCSTDIKLLGKKPISSRDKVTELKNRLYSYRVKSNWFKPVQEVQTELKKYIKF